MRFLKQGITPHKEPHKSRRRKQKALTLAHQGFAFLAEWTGLEPATPGVTGRYSNQLNYHSAVADDFDCLHNPSAVKLGVP